MLETLPLFRFADILSVSEVFARSINIKRDFTPVEDAKVAGYIPTHPTEDVLKAMADATQLTAQERAHLVYGPYGGGKSNLGLVIARLMYSGLSYPALQSVMERIEKGPRPIVAQHLKERWATLEAESPKGFLTVILHSNEGEFRSAMLMALNKALHAEGLVDLIPKTSYDAAQERIRDWQKEHQSVYAQFDALLTREGLTAPELEQQLRKYHQDAYDLFCRLHPLVAAGALFRSEDIARAHEVYEAVAKLLQKQGYAGIFVIWDEFGSYFEEACRSIRTRGSSAEIKELEQFAEMCHGSRRSQVHFLALAHRSFVEYAALANLTAQARDEWKRISARFTPHHLTSTGHERDMYAVLSRIILHGQESRWNAFLAAGGRAAFSQLAVDAIRLGLFAGWNPAEVQDVVRDCYPLHAATCYLLPRVSSAIAQNERTLFTYASSLEAGSLRQTMASVAPFPASQPATVPVDALFSYFAPAIKAEHPGLWDDYTLAIYSAGSEAIAETDRRIIEAMTVWNVTRERVRTLTVDLCRFALAMQTDEDVIRFDAAIERLKDMGVMYERPSDRALFFAGRDQQSLSKAIAEERTRLEHTHNPVDFLRADGADIRSTVLPPPNVEPTAYHRRHKTQRTMQAVLLGATEETKARSLLSGLDGVRDQVDGLLVYVIAQTEDELAAARPLADGVLRHERVLVVLPPTPLELRHDTMQLEALRNLSQRSPFSDAKGGLAHILDDYHATARKKIDEQLRTLLRISHQGQIATVYHNGKIVSSIAAQEDLEGYVDILLAKVYVHNLAIDDEQLSSRPASKQSYAGNSGKIRRSVIDKILEYDKLTKDKKDSLGFASTSPEYRTVRSLLIGCGYLERQAATWTLGRPKRNGNVAATTIYDAIAEYFFAKEGQQQPVRPLIQRLSSPPIGIYSLPLAPLIAVAIRDRVGQLQFFKDGKPVNERVTPLPDLLMDMCYEPGPYSFVSRSVSEEHRLYIELLRESLGRQSREGATDVVASGAATLRNWISEDVTSYARTTTRLEPAAKALRDVALSLRQPDNDAFTLLTVELPRRLGLDQAISHLTLGGVARQEIRTALSSAAQEVATCHNRIDDQVIEAVATVFSLPAGQASDVFNEVSSKVRGLIDAADPQALEPIRRYVEDVLLWLEREHVDFLAAFGELGLQLVSKTNRADWSDGDSDKVRTTLNIVRELVEKLPPKPAPPTAEHVMFLSVLTATLGADPDSVTTAGDPLAVVATAGKEWYNGLSTYAKSTRTLPQDAEDLRDALRNLASAPPRQVLLERLPQRLNLQSEIGQFADRDVSDRVRRRLQGLVTRVANAAIRPPLVVAQAVRTAFHIPTTAEPAEIVQELRAQVEGKIASVGEAPLSDDIRRLLTILRRDDEPDAILRSFGGLAVGLKEDSRWTDADATLAVEEVSRLAKAISALTPTKGSSRCNINLSINGQGSYTSLVYTEGVEMGAKDVETRVIAALNGMVTRDEGKTLGLARVLRRLLEKQQRR